MCTTVIATILLEASSKIPKNMCPFRFLRCWYKEKHRRPSSTISFIGFGHYKYLYFQTLKATSSFWFSWCRCKKGVVSLPPPPLHQHCLFWCKKNTSTLSYPIHSEPHQCLLISAFLSALIEFVPEYGMNVIAASTLHALLLSGVMHLPMMFFDTTPIGRILSRFSKDVEVLDDELPMNISFGLYLLFEVLRSEW